MQVVLRDQRGPSPANATLVPQPARTATTNSEALGPYSMALLLLPIAPFPSTEHRLQYWHWHWHWQPSA